MAYQRDLRKLLDYLEREQKDVREVTLADLEHFSASLHDIGIHPRSQCRILSGIRSFSPSLFSSKDLNISTNSFVSLEVK